MDPGRFICAIAGLTALAFGVGELVQHRRRKVLWKKAVGVVVAGGIARQDGRVRYDVGDGGPPQFVHLLAARRLPEGANIALLYDPARRNRAVPSVSWALEWIVGGAILLLMSSAGLW